MEKIKLLGQIPVHDLMEGPAEAVDRAVPVGELPAVELEEPLAHECAPMASPGIGHELDLLGSQRLRKLENELVLQVGVFVRVLVFGPR